MLSKYISLFNHEYVTYNLGAMLVVCPVRLAVSEVRGRCAGHQDQGIKGNKPPL
jgi:hypothetical protein